MSTMLFAVALAVVVQEWKPQFPVDVAPDGITELEAGLGDSLATAKIRTLRLEGGAHNGGARNRGFHCSGGRDPCSPVLDLEFAVDDRKVWVPSSVFADLADVNVAELRETGDTVTLVLNCGDAASSYSVRIEFNAERVVKRQMVWTFGTNELLEETIYHEVTPLD